jgi:hypothetical protein
MNNDGHLLLFAFPLFFNNRRSNQIIEINNHQPQINQNATSIDLKSDLTHSTATLASAPPPKWLGPRCRRPTLRGTAETPVT